MDTSDSEMRRRAAAIGDELLKTSHEGIAARAVIEKLGAEGLIAARWARSDDVNGVVLIEELASRGLSSAGMVVSVHVEAVLSILRQFARPELHDKVDAALAGTAIGCIAASEPNAGSDLMSVETTAHKLDNTWQITGEKKFATPAAQADFAIVLARIVDESMPGRLGAFLVPRDGFEIVKTHQVIAGSSLDTSWIRLDATVPSHHLLGRPGLGTTVLNWGLTKERLAAAALVVGTCGFAIMLAVTRAQERRQFGQRLFDHQAIRLRLADLHSQVEALRSDVRYLASRPSDPRRIAGLKVTTARFGEHCLSECMHIFGGDGYVEDASPLGRLWRDVRFARLAGGTDEMMWELVASGLDGDQDAYRRHVPAATCQ